VIFGLSAFWLILAAAMFFVDGGFAIVGPYAARSGLAPQDHRHGAGYARGIGKIIGPAGLALIWVRQL